MPRREPPSLYVVAAPAEKHGFFGWAARLRGLFKGKSGRGRLPDDLLADVLADNGLRAREQERRRPQISGPRR